MRRKLISAIGLLALAASHAAALVGPLLAGHPPDCCNGTLCSTQRHGRPAPAKPDCHQPGEAGLGDCSMRSCNPPEHRAVGSQPYLLPEPLLTSQEAPLAFEIPQAALFFPARSQTLIARRLARTSPSRNGQAHKEHSTRF